MKVCKLLPTVTRLLPQVMELETAVQVSTNQMKRQEEENKRLQEALDTAESNIRTMQSQLGDHKRKYTDLESQASVPHTTTTTSFCLWRTEAVLSRHCSSLWWITINANANTQILADYWLISDEGGENAGTDSGSWKVTELSRVNTENLIFGIQGKATVHFHNDIIHLADGGGGKNTIIIFPTDHKGVQGIEWGVWEAPPLYTLL